MSRQKVLVVDDDPGMVGLLSDFLEKEGYAVATADCGRGALAALESERPDLVLLDVHMPGVSGLEALARIRETHPELPVVIITGHGSEDVAVQALRAGADDYLAKPVRMQAACVRVRAAMERGRLRAEHERLTRQLRDASDGLAQGLQAAEAAGAALRQAASSVLARICSAIAEGDQERARRLCMRLHDALDAADPLVAVQGLADPPQA